MEMQESFHLKCNYFLLILLYKFFISCFFYSFWLLTTNTNINALFIIKMVTFQIITSLSVPFVVLKIHMLRYAVIFFFWNIREMIKVEIKINVFEIILTFLVMLSYQCKNVMFSIF